MQAYTIIINHHLFKLIPKDPFPLFSKILKKVSVRGLNFSRLKSFNVSTSPEKLTQ